MSATPEPVAQTLQPRRARKFCTGCSVVKDAAEFYPRRTNPRTGSVILFAHCKPCMVKETTEDRQLRLVRERRIERIASLDVTIGEVVYLSPRGRRGRQDDPVSVREWDPAFVVKITAPASLPVYGTTPNCPRGEHDWPVETLCRGYEALGCGGIGPHVHRRCLIHSYEETEAVPTFLIGRRRG